MRKLLQFGCETMREGVIVALIFFVFGVLMTLVGVHVMPHIANMHHIITLIGFVLLLISPIILILTFILSVLPGTKDQLENCD